MSAASPTLVRRPVTEHDYREMVRAIDHLRVVADVYQAQLETEYPPAPDAVILSRDLGRALHSAERAAKRIVSALQVRIGGRL